MLNVHREYYLNNGKLDLSLLDENIELEQEMMMDFEDIYIETDIYISEESQIEEEMPCIQVSQETQNTLKELGSYFTRK